MLDFCKNKLIQRIESLVETRQQFYKMSWIVVFYREISIMQGVREFSHEIGGRNSVELKWIALTARRLALTMEIYLKSHRSSSSELTLTSEMPPFKDEHVLVG